ncbi:hypothetical protein E6C64_15290 [Naasia lichenicola]|uniref:Uncharacterized protein n=1 Tax=Naasia lichenicola TaxID=2565933 RepID=A0A4S4FLN5_9MICO|nr:hypothetical protein E6C64_15290 [Naasia lichenicola]
MAARPAPAGNTTREDVLEREKARFGGIKFGSAFFGWLTATGTAVLFTAVLSAVGAAIGLGNDLSADQVADSAAENADTVSIVGAIVVAVVLFISYFCGGYVAGRMARFDGLKQGVAVWLWAIIVIVVLAVVGLIANTQSDFLGSVSGLPSIPINGASLTAGGIISGVIALVVTLVGAILGGLAGMRYHRRVDRAGLGR